MSPLVSRVAVLLGVLAWTEAHLTVICTSSSPQQPNTFAFWFITYAHGTGPGYTAPGKVFIQDPSAKVIEADFSNVCKPTGPHVSASGSTVADFEGVLKSKCAGLSDPQGRVPVFSDSAVECYNADNNNPVPDYAGGLRKGQTVLTDRSSSMTDYFYVVVEGSLDKPLMAGAYVTWFTGTDQVLAACPSQYPCSLASKPWTFDISVVTGPPKCTSAPAAVANAVPGSMVGCDDVYAGGLCHAQCAPSYSKIGTLECKDNGDGTASWGSAFACTNEVVCGLPKAGNNAAISSDVEGILHPCATLTPAGTSCQYTCKGFNQVSVGEITCKDVNGQGVWEGGNNYDGCAWTVAPTPSPCTGVQVSVDGVAVAGVSVGGAENNNAGGGVSLSKIPAPLNRMDLHVPSLPVATGSTVELSCCGSEPCEFVLSHYHCPPCSSSVNGGFPASLPVHGFTSASCGPRYGTTEQRMSSHHLQLQPGEKTAVPTTAEATSFVVFSQVGAFTEPWCPTKKVGCGGPCPINICKCVDTL
eukprot:TRINITY_DN62_c0_g1_i1.p2 TRINITY_DN62_c0_g1~~TRINITY_DN62_c0_g1_i1.p2  ORF type:complete len:527 (+),score=152.34 TRINITY_DN62_c0_g1_i1:64-1644(+)